MCPQSNGISLPGLISALMTDSCCSVMQQRNYPRTSLKLLEPAAGGTGEWTWQRRLSPPAVPAAVTNPALPAHLSPSHTHNTQHTAHTSPTLTPPLPPSTPLSTSGHRAPWLSDVRPDPPPHSPGLAKRLCIAAFLIPFFVDVLFFLFTFFKKCISV